MIGIVIFAVTLKQKAHVQETRNWMMAALLLGIVGGTLGGLIVFGGGLIYFIIYFI